ncbi:NEDD4-binding protein 1 isoform X2 [Ambystoma mexicanum]
MHCIFAGAKNVFLDGIIYDTCADVSVSELGNLSINGSEEAVVLAQSRIQQFVHLFESNLSLPSTIESSVKRTFKCFVETHADKYTMDLLLLPSSLKEELFNLTSHTMSLEPEDVTDSSDLEIVQHSCTQNARLKQDEQSSLEDKRNKAGTPVSELTKKMDTVLSDSAQNKIASVNDVVPIQESGVPRERSSCKRRCSDFEERLTKKQFSFENENEDSRESFGAVTVVDVVDLLSDSCTDLDDSVIFVKDYDVTEEGEYNILVNFFKTMGYSKEIVEKVIGEFGQSEEPLKLLDEIEKEHKKVQETKAAVSCITGSSNVLRNIGANMNMSHTGNNSAIVNTEKSKRDQLGYPTGKLEPDVMHEVIDCQPINPKTSKRTVRVATNFSVSSASTITNSLCQTDCTGKNDSLEVDGSLHSNFSVQELVKKDMFKDSDIIARGSSSPPLQDTAVTKTITLRKKSPEPFNPQNNGLTRQQLNCNNPSSLHTKASPTKCLPNPTPVNQKSTFLPENANSGKKKTDSSATRSQRFNVVAPTIHLERQNRVDPSGTESQSCPLTTPYVGMVRPNALDPSGSQVFYPYVPEVNTDRSFPGGEQFPIPPPTETVAGSKATDPSVTGSQRFFNIIKVPYKLELQNEPGKSDLKHIIIDGSNVAMRHGLDKYFSCRGIALAVEHFWKQGHRNVTVFVPQWRTKRVGNTTELHFLQQLQELGILSLTPARMVLGSRIASHDDRFLLHLSEKTGGVIVTNDNFREFVTESPAWKRIIQERILPYTFAGDIFMVPDDPLGRHGPKLQDFLRKRPQNHLKQPNFQQMHFHQPRFQHPNFSNPLMNTDMNISGTPLIHPIAIATSGGCPPQHKHNTDPLHHCTPLVKKMLNTVTIPPPRTAEETTSLKSKLMKIFPDFQQRQKIEQILTSHPYMRDLNALSAMVLD